MKEFELKHCGNSILIYDFSHSEIDEKEGNPYNTTFLVKVVSGMFSGTCQCEYDYKEFKKFAKEITELYKFKTSKVILNDICYGSQIVFVLDELGHLVISGEIFGSAMIHSMKFEFEADQTSLKSFTESLEMICS